MNLIETLSDLSRAHGPAGAEDQAAELAMTLLAPYVDEVSRDPLGNVIGRRVGNGPGAKRVLIEAHIDEVGFIVTGHRGSFLSLAPLGSIDPRHLPGTRLRVLSDPRRVGVVACLPPHLLSKGDMDKVTGFDDTVLDLGLTEEETKQIPLGTPVVYDTEPLQIGETRFSGKAMDNRACVAAILLVLEKLPRDLDIDLTVLFSVQEELGMRGAKTGAYATKPDVAVTLDVTFAHTPDASKEKTVPLGSGAAIGVGAILTRAVSNRLKHLAETENIPYQVEVLADKTSTTADMLQIAGTGAQTALISLPLRYMHSASELVDLSDIEAVASLLAAFLLDLNGGADHA